MGPEQHQRKRYMLNLCYTLAYLKFSFVSLLSIKARRKMKFNKCQYCHSMMWKLSAGAGIALV